MRSAKTIPSQLRIEIWERSTRRLSKKPEQNHYNPFEFDKDERRKHGQKAIEQLPVTIDSAIKIR